MAAFGMACPWGFEAPKVSADWGYSARVLVACGARILRGRRADSEGGGGGVAAAVSPHSLVYGYCACIALKRLLPSTRRPPRPANPSSRLRFFPVFPVLARACPWVFGAPKGGC